MGGDVNLSDNPLGDIANFGRNLPSTSNKEALFIVGVSCLRSVFGCMTLMLFKKINQQRNNRIP